MWRRDSQLTRDNFKITVFLVILSNFMLSLKSQPILANPANIESLKILHPSIDPVWLPVGKLLLCQFTIDRLLIPIALLSVQQLQLAKN